MKTITYPRKAGVYKMTCIDNGKIYIGKSYNIHQRINRHRQDADKLKNMGYFQRAIVKHGWESFKVEILEIIEDFDKSKDGRILLDIEASYIRMFKSNDERFGYNICEYSTDRTGHKCSDETKQKMSKARIGHKCSEETREKMRNRVYSEETREKMRKSKLGRVVSEETREKMRQSRIGYKMTEETKDKMRKINTGRTLSDEHKEKLRQAKLGKPLSEEHKQRLKEAKSKSTYIHSEETKLKIGLSSKNRGRKVVNEN